jgi:hypothetical protein
MAPSPDLRNGVILLLTLIGIVFLVVAVHEDSQAAQVIAALGFFLLAYVYAKITGPY